MHIMLWILQYPCEKTFCSLSVTIVCCTDFAYISNLHHLIKDVS